MDEEQGTQKLSELWLLAKSRQGVTIDREGFIQQHSLQIRMKSKGYWVMPVASDYIQKLEESIVKSEP